MRHCPCFLGTASVCAIAWRVLRQPTQTGSHPSLALHHLSLALSQGCRRLSLRQQRLPAIAVCVPVPGGWGVGGWRHPKECGSSLALLSLGWRWILPRAQEPSVFSETPLYSQGQPRRSPTVPRGQGTDVASPRRALAALLLHQAHVFCASGSCGVCAGRAALTHRWSRGSPVPGRSVSSVC